MKSLIWTFVKRKPQAFLVDRYHYIKNQDELDDLVEELLDIDAVSTPVDLTFPVMLEVENGFAPSLIKADVIKMRRELNKLQKMVDKAARSVEDKPKAIKPRKIKEKR